MQKEPDPRRKTLAVDYDGTICERGFPRHMPVRPGAREVLEQLEQDGWYILVYSSRTCLSFRGSEEAVQAEIDGMRAHLTEQKVPFHEIYDGKDGKPIADIYADDRAVRPDNWYVAYEEIRRLGEFTVINKRDEQQYEEGVRLTAESLRHTSTSMMIEHLNQARALLRHAQVYLAGTFNALRVRGTPLRRLFDDGTATPTNEERLETEVREPQ